MLMSEAWCSGHANPASSRALIRSTTQTTARRIATYLRNSGPLIWRQLLAGARPAGVFGRSLIRSHRWRGWIDWASRPGRDRTCRHSEIRGHERVRAALVQSEPQFVPPAATTGQKDANEIITEIRRLFQRPTRRRKTKI